MIQVLLSRVHRLSRRAWCSFGPQSFFCPINSLYASFVITQEDYERTFPLSQLSVLAKIQKLPLAEWSAPQAAHAALAPHAFG